MIAAYAFFMTFAAQILVVSVLHPIWVINYARVKAEAQLPDFDRDSRDRFFRQYRAINILIAGLGLALLGWMLSQAKGPDWNLQLAVRLLSNFVMAQLAPFCLLSVIAAWVKRKALMNSPPIAKRTATLKRYGLFQIVAPATVALALIAYILFVGAVIYIRHQSIPGFTGYTSLSGITAIYLLNAMSIYWLLYRRKRWPLETSGYRMEAIAEQVKLSFYVGFVAVAFLSLRVVLNLLHLQPWMPFATSVYVVAVMSVSSFMLFALRRQADMDRLNFQSAV
ncbi:MAG TPA: hypothetical protein VIR04_06465 [Paralcaligenes sp.]